MTSHISKVKLKQFAAAIALLLTGVIFGGYIFSKSEPRFFLAFTSCQKRCYKPNEIAGLFASSAIQRIPFIIPDVVLESDTCIAIRNPKPEARIHYVLFPKHDTRNITTLTPEDSPYIMGCFSLAHELVTRDHLLSYRLYTNGPANQEISYLHFHLTSNVSTPNSKWGIQLITVMLKLFNGIRDTTSRSKSPPSRGRLPAQLRRVSGVMSG